MKGGGSAPSTPPRAASSTSTPSCTASRRVAPSRPHARVPAGHAARAPNAQRKRKRTPHDKGQPSHHAPPGVPHPFSNGAPPSDLSWPPRSLTNRGHQRSDQVRTRATQIDTFLLPTLGRQQTGNTEKAQRRLTHRRRMAVDHVRRRSATRTEGRALPCRPSNQTAPPRLRQKAPRRRLVRASTNNPCPCHPSSLVCRAQRSLPSDGSEAPVAGYLSALTADKDPATSASLRYRGAARGLTGPPTPDSPSRHAAAPPP